MRRYAFLEAACFVEATIEAAQFRATSTVKGLLLLQIESVVVFSREVWATKLRKLHLDVVVAVQEERVLHWWLRYRKMVPKQVC